MIISAVTLNVAARYTATFMMMSVYGSFAQGPRYWQANVVNVAFSAACIALATALRLYPGWGNRELEHAGNDDDRTAGTVVGTG